MSSSSDDVRATASDAKSCLLQRLRDDVNQTEAARLLGTNKHKVNRLVNLHAEGLFALMAIAGLRVVDANASFIPEEDLEALRTLAGRGLQTLAVRKVNS